jgi:hypothetical protein
MVVYVWKVLNMKDNISTVKFEDYLYYDPNTGSITWKRTKGSRAKTGTNAGNLSKNGYLVLGFDGKDFYAHRVAWLLHYGQWPTNLVDHVNGVKTDNRILNLREVTKSENAQNQKTSCKTSETNYLGVHYDTRRGRYVAKIMLNYKTKHIGVFKSAEEAYAAYLLIKRQIHPANTL